MKYCTDNQTFIRPNRSEMINKTFVSGISIAESAITLFDGQKVIISHRRVKEFQAWI